MKAVVGRRGCWFLGTPRGPRGSVLTIRKCEIVRAYARRMMCLCLLVFLIGSVGPSAGAGQPLDPSLAAPVRLLGFLAHPADAASGPGSYGPFFMDEANRRVYAVYASNRTRTTHLVEFDLGSWPVPTMLRDVDLKRQLEGWQRPNLIAVDSARRRALFVSNVQHLPGVLLIDLKRLRVIEEWTLAEMGAPGVSALGITYSPQDKLFYFIGRGMSDGATVVGAIDSIQYRVTWLRPISECQQAMYTFGVGAFIASSRNKRALYFACVKPNDTLPGEAGLVRLWIRPGATQQQSSGFDLDFFPISGVYQSGEGITGFAAFDYRTERFYMLSQSTSTPGAWVFDGRMSSWVGFITATDETDKGLGIDQSNGHVYIKSGRDGRLILADGRATPVPQGIHIDYDPTAGLYLVDPKTHRAFIWTARETRYGLRGDVGVLLDSTPKARSAIPPRYDARTHDIPEGPNTITNFSSGLSGFGTRLLLIGGHKALANQDFGLRSGDRGFSAARVTSLDLRPVGALASAQAAIADANTGADLDDNGVEGWPWLPATCLDGSGKKTASTQSAHAGEASVTCDLENERVEARASYSAVRAEGVSVASSDFDASVYRDPKRGSVTHASAVATGVRLSVLAGSVSIAEVRSMAETAAHGRPGTAETSWKRVLSGIEIRDGNDEIVQRIPQCSTTDEEDECRGVVREINEVLQTRMRVDLFEPERIETPKGAFAAVQQSDAEFYHARTVYNQGTAFAGEAGARTVPAMQITVFNDGAEKSRLVVQLAALQANSIYTVSPEPTYDDGAEPTTVDLPDTGGSTDLPVLEAAPPDISGLGGARSLDTGSVPQAPVPAQPMATGSPANVVAFFTREPAEALLFVAVWLLLGAAGWSVYRHRSLLLTLREGE
jgi:hypothetical protein